jgi:hypothetical protein
MMGILLSILLPVLKSLGCEVSYDVGIPPSYFVVGGLIILVIGAGIILAIVFTVRYLVKHRKEKTKDV